jgi:hypothetical protein
MLARGKAAFKMAEISHLLLRLALQIKISELYFPGNISKNCTSDGWSETFPDFIDACGYNDSEDESKVGSQPSPHWELHTLRLWSAGPPQPTRILWSPSLCLVQVSASALLQVFGTPVIVHSFRGRERQIFFTFGQWVWTVGTCGWTPPVSNHPV